MLYDYCCHFGLDLVIQKYLSILNDARCLLGRENRHIRHTDAHGIHDVHHSANLVLFAFHQHLVGQAVDLEQLKVLVAIRIEDTFIIKKKECVNSGILHKLKPYLLKYLSISFKYIYYQIWLIAYHIPGRVNTIRRPSLSRFGSANK